MKKQNCFILFFCILAYFSFAQTDSTDQKFTEDSLRLLAVKPVSPQFKFDTRGTFVWGKAVNMYGYDAGILVNNKLRLTLGYYRIDDVSQVSGDAGTEEKKIMIRCGTLNSEML